MPWAAEPDAPSAQALNYDVFVQRQAQQHDLASEETELSEQQAQDGVAEAAATAQ